MATPLQSCQTRVSTIFVFGSIADQTAANMVYTSRRGEYASSISGASPVQHTTKLMFKTDFERMQYLIGLYGRSSQGLR
jgi:hypothetical protein